MKESTVPATRTYALVVGIEKYALGSGPGIDLDGPAHDACKFADWLVSRGVPQKNIALLLSPLDSNSSFLGEWSVSSQWPATRKGVSDVATQWLPKQAGELLWVFWGGHGVMTATRSRRLLYADTTTADWYHLDLESLLIRFSSDNLPSFQQQIYLIDTCANYRRQLPQERLGDGDRFAPGEPVRGHEQFVFFATREGEVAKNLSQEQTGLFSKMVLEELAKEPSRSWPPDMEKLAARVRESFSDPAKAEKTKQRPIFASYRTWDGTEYVFGQQADQAPAIWNVPYSRNPFFTGREDSLSRLQKQLQAGQKAALSQPQAISGLGGIGKTQIAVEYAYQHADTYQTILWARAESHETLTSSFVEIAATLDLPQKDAEDQMLTVKAVKYWLQGNNGWLLILDNADEPAIVREFLPTKFDGHILLTTRAQALGRLAQRIEVDSFTPELGALFLLRRASIVATYTSIEQAILQDREVAIQISEELGGLPLALDQAGAYIEETGCRLQEYQQIYQQRRRELLKQRRGLEEDYPKPVATTWSLSFARVEEKNSAVAELLRFCAFLAPDDIAVEMIAQGAPYLGPVLEPLAGDPYELNQAIEVLRASSLVQRDPSTGALSIHRLVQAVLRDALPAEETRRWVERTVRAVNAAFPEVELAQWAVCEQYLPHALACALLLEEGTMLVPKSLFEKVDPTVLEGRDTISSMSIFQTASGAVHLLTRMGWYLRERARYKEAEPIVQRALAMSEQQLEADPVDIAQILNILAGIYEAQGRYAEAEPLYRRALTIYEHLFGSEHPYTVRNLNNLASLYHVQGEYAKAECLYKRALTIREQVLGVEHPDTAANLNNLALLYDDQGKYEEAELLYKQALAIYERVLGASHPDTATSLNNLAALYKEQGKYEEAEPLIKRALAIREQVLGASHPDTANSLNDLAGLSFQQGAYAEAKRLYLQALAIYEHLFGPHHPDTANSLNNLAGPYCEQGEYTQAQSLLDRALTICEQQLGPDHPDTAMSLHNLARLHDRQGHYTEAEPLYQRALVIREQHLGQGHPYTLITREKYSNLLQKMRKEAEDPRSESDDTPSPQAP